MRYKNCGLVPQSFYGVTFNPGEEHDVPGYITAKNFIKVFDEKASQNKRKRVGRPPKDQKDQPSVKETKQPVTSLDNKEDTVETSKEKE